MKLRVIILTIILALAALSGKAQGNVFEKIEKIKDVQALHVSKSLLNMISEMDTKTADFSLLADKLKQFDVYSSMTQEAAASMKSHAEVFGKDKSYETFMSVKDNNQNVVFYGKKNGDKFQELIMVVDAADGTQIMRFLGDFTAKDIQEVIKKK